MEEPTTLRIQKGAQDRRMRALQVVVESGFIIRSRWTENFCLTLCNAFRNAVPLVQLPIGRGVPRSLMRLICPDYPELGTPAASRVQPYRRIWRVQWTFYGRSAASEGKHEYTGREGESTLASDPTDIRILSKVKWPEGLKDLVLWGVDQAIDHIVWPPSLERLAFGEHDFFGRGLEPQESFMVPNNPRLDQMFNQPLDQVIFPPSVRELLLGSAFDQPINRANWPQELDRLSLPGFNQSIHSVRWPPKLKVLDFTPLRFWHDDPRVAQESYRYHVNNLGEFDQYIGSALPSTLEVLRLPGGYNHPLSDVAWPNGLVELVVGDAYGDFLPVEGPGWSNIIYLVVQRTTVIGDYGLLPSGCKVHLMSVIDFDYNLEEDKQDH